MASQSPKGHQTRQAEHINAQLIHHIYKQSYIGIVISVINAAALTILMWPQVNHGKLSLWFSTLLLVTGLRAVLVHQYHHVDVPPDQAKTWGNLNIAGLALTGGLWGCTMIITFPSESLTHQLCTALLLCGIIATAISMYAVLPIAVVAFCLPIFLAWIIRFLTFGDLIHTVIAGMAMLYMGIMMLTSNHIFRTRRQLLMTRYNLANRVTEGTLALEKSNADLQKEIQERKDIEERLRQEKDRLETITATIGAGLAVISRKYRIMWTNRIFEDIFGTSSGKRCFKSMFLTDKACDNCGAQMVFEQGCEKAVDEHRIPGKDGIPLWFQIVTTPIRNVDGEIEAALTLVIPITDRKEAEAARISMSRKLEEARKTEAIATLAGGIAHQFNNALAVIAGNIELMEFDYENDPNIQSFTAPIFKSTQKMAQLTSQLLAYAKGGKYKDHPADLGEVVDTTISLIKHTIPSAINLTKALDANLPKAMIDVTQIQMAISSIVSNAVEATENSGMIHISCKSLTVSENNSLYDKIPPGRYVTFATTDDGVGMNEETRQRIFEPFFTTKFEGRGLGMAAVYGIIKNHRGHIHVSSKPKNGTEIRIYLPVVEEMANSSADVKDQMVKGSGTILVVEDDLAIVEVDQAWLKRLGYKAITATSAREAIDMISDTDIRFDLVLLDLVLPDMDGAAIYPHIQKHRPQVKVIICSGYGEAGSTQELLEAGAHGFLQKPFTLSQISKKINEVLPSG